MSSPIEKKYYQTLFIAELSGQTQLWDKVISQEAQHSEEIVQMGNFITCYPEITKDKITRKQRNAGIVKRLELYRATQPNWYQLVGPNEIIALNQPGVFTDEETDRWLRRAWFSDEPKMRIAEVNKNRLVTHGGLTHGMWTKIGRPSTAQETADALNEEFAKTLFQGKSHRLGSPPNYSANPIWANPILETLPSWITSEEECPFDQIHAAESIGSKEGRLIRGSEGSVYSFVDRIDFRKFGANVFINEALFISLILELEPQLINRLPDHRTLYREEALRIHFQSK